MKHETNIPAPDAENERVLSEIDIADDGALRFAQRVLESDAPESDRKDARDMLVAIRTRVRKVHAAGKRATLADLIPSDAERASPASDGARVGSEQHAHGALPPLKPCPCCGSDADWNAGIGWFSIFCTNADCAIETEAWSSTEKPLSIWNRRASCSQVAVPEGILKVAVDMLREVVGPLEVSAAIIESEDGGEAIESLIDKVKGYVEQFDRAALPGSAPTGVQPNRGLESMDPQRLRELDAAMGSTKGQE